MLLPQGFAQPETTSNSRGIPFFHLSHFSLTKATNCRQRQEMESSILALFLDPFPIFTSHLLFSYRTILSQQL